MTDTTSTVGSGPAGGATEPVAERTPRSGFEVTLWWTGPDGFPGSFRFASGPPTPSPPIHRPNREFLGRLYEVRSGNRRTDPGRVAASDISWRSSARQRTKSSYTTASGFYQHTFQRGMLINGVGVFGRRANITQVETSGPDLGQLGDNDELFVIAHLAMR